MNVSDYTLQGLSECCEPFRFRALFNWVSKIIWKYNGFALLCSVISPENSATPSTIRCITHACHDLVVHVFTALDRLLVFTLSCHWFFMALSFLLIGLGNSSVVLVLHQSIEERSNNIVFSDLID